jgi:NAD(P)-dependent dehydrogenase (short-subunit alcohol dehydrogenase family)
MSLLSPAFDPAREAALVTGAGNGIGRAIAQALVGEGVRTVFADVSEERVTLAVKASARPGLALPWVGDLASPAAREALLAHARADVTEEAANPAEEVEAVLDWLQAQRYLCEERFVESRVHARASRFGNVRIRRELGW